MLLQRIPSSFSILEFSFKFQASLSCGIDRSNYCVAVYETFKYFCLLNELCMHPSLNLLVKHYANQQLNSLVVEIIFSLCDCFFNNLCLKHSSI